MGNLLGHLFSSATVSRMADGGLLIPSAPGRYLAWALVLLVVAPTALWCWQRGIGGHYAPGAFIDEEPSEGLNAIVEPAPFLQRSRVPIRPTIEVVDFLYYLLGEVFRALA